MHLDCGTKWQICDAHWPGGWAMATIDGKAMSFGARLVVILPLWLAACAAPPAPPPPAPAAAVPAPAPAAATGPIALAPGMTGPPAFELPPPAPVAAAPP